MLAHPQLDVPVPGLGRARLTARLFGELTVRGGAVVLGPADLGGAQPRRILQALLVEAGSTVSKDRLVAILWPGDVPGGAVATLETYVSVLRGRLRAAVGSQPLVRTASRGYRIERRDVEVDLQVFTDLVEHARLAPPDLAADLLDQAISMANEPLLVSEPDAAWADDVRRAHAARMTDALLAAALLAQDRGDVSAAVGFAARVVAREPLNESAWAVKIESLERAGRAAEALAEYGVCRRVLAEELGCAPGPALQDTFRRLLRMTADDDVPGVVWPAALPTSGVVHEWAAWEWGGGRVNRGASGRRPLTMHGGRRHS